MSFTTILDTLRTTLFSRAFWFGSFLPVAIVAAIHALLAVYVAHVPAKGLTDTILGGDAPKAALAGAATVVLAYMLAPLTPLFNGLLDGTLLPRWLHDALRRARGQQWRTDVKAYRDAMTASARADRLWSELLLRLKEVRSTGAAPNRRLVQAQVDTARTMVDELGPVPYPVTLDYVDKMERAGDALVEALAGEVHQPGQAATDPEIRNAAFEAHAQLELLLREVRHEARHGFRAAAQRLPTLDLQERQATRLGDARRRRERYARDAYHVDYDFLWPRVRLAIEGGEGDAGTGLPREAADAAAQVRFAVQLLALSCTIPLFWLPYITAVGGSAWALLAIGVATPPVLIALYELAVRSEMAFGAVVETVLDRHRLAALAMFAMPKPATLSAERQMWRRLEQVGTEGRAVELVYEHAQAAATVV